MFYCAIRVQRQLTGVKSGRYLKINIYRNFKLNSRAFSFFHFKGTGTVQRLLTGAKSGRYQLIDT